jgi:hypothetical protein
VPDTPVPKELTDLDEGWEEDGASGLSDRPTVAPPFDLASYAKENAAGPANQAWPSPEKTRARHTGRSLEDRIDEQLQASFDSEESGARAPSDTALTMPPPANATGGPSGGPPSDPLSRRETPKENQRIEAARVLSAREDVGTGTILSLANMRVPSNLPPRVIDDPVLTVVDSDEDSAGEEDKPVSSEPMKEMQERFALGDYSGALVMAESLLEENPTHVEAREYAESCRAVLQQMYAAKIGPLDRVPVVEVAREQLRWLSIDHRAGFVLSLVDGVSSLEMILDVSGMPSLDALRILYELHQQRIIAFRDG